MAMVGPTDRRLSMMPSICVFACLRVSGQRVRTEVTLKCHCGETSRSVWRTRRMLIRPIIFLDRKQAEMMPSNCVGAKIRMKFALIFHRCQHRCFPRGRLNVPRTIRRRQLCCDLGQLAHRFLLFQPRCAPARLHLPLRIPSPKPTGTAIMSYVLVTRKDAAPLVTAHTITDTKGLWWGMHSTLQSADPFSWNMDVKRLTMTTSEMFSRKQELWM